MRVLAVFVVLLVILAAALTAEAYIGGTVTVIAVVIALGAVLAARSWYIGDLGLLRRNDRSRD
jgi:hypothetical protein